MKQGKFKGLLVELVFVYFQQQDFNSKEEEILKFQKNFPQLRPIYLVTK